MRILHLDAGSIAAGETAFDDYSKALTIGPAGPFYEIGLNRQTGIEFAPGAISKAISLGYDHNQIVTAVARATRCKRSTIEDILDALTGDDPGRHLWSYMNDRYLNWSDIEAASPRVALAA